MPGENRYLIIGIDEYPNTRYKRIANAKVDGDRMAKLLQERYGFIPGRAPLYDSEATGENIREAILELGQTCYEEDSLIIYFAGHGAQHPFSKKGYWIPVDGEEDQKKYLYNSTILDDIETIRAKHILLISDSCYSGTFISRTREGGKALAHDDLDALVSRWVFVSGGEEPVSDGKAGEGSPFGIAICNFLEKNETPSVAAGELFDAVINKQFYRPHAFDLVAFAVPIEEKRKTAYYFEHPMQKTCVTTIDLPAGFEVETLPVNQSLKFTYGNYEIKYVYDAAKNQVISTAKFNLTNQVIPAAKYTELQQYLDAVAKAQNKKLVIRRKA